VKLSGRSFVANLHGVIASLLILATLGANGQGKSGFRVVKVLQVGGEGGWDCITFESTSRCLFASHGNQVMVVSTDSGAVVGSIQNTQGVHGVAVANDLGKGYVSDGRANTVTVFDVKSLQTLKEVPVGRNPDAILHDPFTERVFVFNGRGHSASVLSAESDTVIATIPLGGKPEFAVTDLAGRIYVNIEDMSEVLSIDAISLNVLSRWPVAPGEEPSGLAIDREQHRLFSVCGNEKMVVLDCETGKVVASVATGKGTDGCVFDPGLRYAYASNGEGTVTVVYEESPSTFTVVDNVQSRRGARTIAIDPVKHVIYLPTADFGPTPAPTIEHPRPRPSIIPDSFVILQLEQR
jgi:YVTN family beta-propeller protein